jgi:RNA polymerase sigma factor (sigma-70 family)
MKEAPDQFYIDKIKEGDTDLYAFLVDRYKYMAYTIALKVLGNKDDSQDVAQESFIKAYQQLHTFKGNSKFSTWLYTIVYRTAISKWKENRLETQSIDEPLHERYASDQASQPHDQLQAKDEQAFVKRAIQRLPRTEALLVTLFYINESSIKEIREITGLSLPNIKIKLFRARKRLERELKFLMDSEPEMIVADGKR